MLFRIKIGLGRIGATDFNFASPHFAKILIRTRFVCHKAQWQKRDFNISLKLVTMKMLTVKGCQRACEVGVGNERAPCTPLSTDLKEGLDGGLQMSVVS